MIKKELSGKILVVGTDYRGNGGIATVIDCYRQLFEQFNFICTHRFVGRFQQVLLVLFACLKLACFCLFKGIRIVHIHAASYRSFYVASICVLIAKLCGKKVILHLHGGSFEPFFERNRTFCLTVTRRVDAIVAVSGYFGKLFRRLQLNENIEIIYNMISLPQKVKNNYSFLHEDKLKILFLGTLDDNKGIFEVLKIFASHLEKVKEKFVLFVGGNGEVERFHQYIQDFGLQDVVVYCGWLSGEDKEQKFLDADVYIQPSHFESLGISILEAMSYGLPVIATKTGGIPELVEDRINGFLINVGDMKMLYEYLMCFYKDRKLCQAMGEKGKLKASHFAQNATENQIIELYTKLL